MEIYKIAGPVILWLLATAHFITSALAERKGMTVKAKWHMGIAFWHSCVAIILAIAIA